MRHPFRFLFFFLIAVCVHAQTSNVNMIGRWPEGHSRAVFRRNGVTFVGTGAAVEAYQYRSGTMVRLDRLVLSGPVYDIWVQSDVTDQRPVYLACGEKGLKIVYFTFSTATFSSTVDSLDTPGFAGGVAQFGSLVFSPYLFVADGEKGLFIADVTNMHQPQQRGTLNVKGLVHDVWVMNDSTALLAGDMEGVYSVRITDKNHPVALDSLDFPEVFVGSPPSKAYHVLAVDTVAYVSMGWGGFRTVDIRDPSNLTGLGLWTFGGTAVDVRGAWVQGTNAYLAGLDRGFFSEINISNPSSPTGPAWLPLDTDGHSYSLIVEQDTVYLADGYGGFKTIILEDFVQPRIEFTRTTADFTYDVALSGSYGYTAQGLSGLKVFNLNILSPPVDSIEVLGTAGTQGEARGLKKGAGNLVYVANGSKGLAVMDVTNPYNPSFVDGFPDGTSWPDSSVDVDVSGNFAYLACRSDGMRVVAISGALAEVPNSHINTPGTALSVRIANQKAYIADQNGIYVYDVSSLPGPSGYPLLASLTSGSCDVRALDVTGDTVFAANGSYGFLLWNVSTGNAVRVSTGTTCTDVQIREKTLYITDLEQGLKVYDFSLSGQFTLVGYCTTAGKARRVFVSGNHVAIADGEGGLYYLESTIEPEITVTPTALNFGPVSAGYTRKMILRVRNTGTTLLRITDVDCNNTRYTFMEDQFAVVPGDTHRLVVAFHPTTSDLGDIIAAGRLYSNAGNVDISLQGRSVAHVTEGPYTTDVLTLGLWHLDEGSGGVADDATAYQNDGIVHGTPARIASKTGFGNAVSFDGVDDWVEFPNDTLWDVSRKDFTAELWFRMNQKPSGYYILMKRGYDDGVNSQYELSLGASEGIMGRVWDNAGNVKALTFGPMSSLNIGQWYHAALTWDGDTLKLHVNGVVRARMAFWGRLRANTVDPLSIGGTSNMNPHVFFKGAIDEFRLSGIARESWEFHVNRSQIEASESLLDFGDVWLGQSRRLPLTLGSRGTENLVISSISSTSPGQVTFTPFSTPFVLQQGRDTTMWVMYSPNTPDSLNADSLQIVSTDPTFPILRLSTRGEGVQSLPAGAYVTDPFTAGLYHFDSATGTVIDDSSPAGMDGTWPAGNWTGGKFASALSFAQGNMAVITPTPGHHVQPRWGGVTAELWFRVSALPAGKAVLVRRGTPSLSQFELVLNGATLQGAVYDTGQDSVRVQGGSVLPNQWYHAALVLDGDSLFLFLNGSKSHARPFAGDPAGSDGNPSVDTLSILIGRDWQNSMPFAGIIDEMRISDIGRQSWEFNVNLARAALSPGSIAFGEVPLGKTRTVKCRVRNEGIADLIVSDVASTSPRFTADLDAFTLAPGQDTLIKVTFTPVDNITTHSGSITLTTNDPFNETCSISVMGKGISGLPSGSYGVDPFTLALYHMDEEAPDTLWNEAGAGFTGMTEGNVASSRPYSGRYDWALAFDGSGDRIRFDGDPFSRLDFQDFTLEFWFFLAAKPADSSWTLFRNTVQQPNIELSLHPDSGLVASVQDASYHSVLYGPDMESLRLGQWVHTALSWDGAFLRLYLNNEVMDSAALGRPLQFAGTQMILAGSGVAGHDLNGAIDELRISSIFRQPWECTVMPRSASVSVSALDFATVLVGQSRTLGFSIFNGGDQDLNVEIGQAVIAEVFSLQSASDTAFTVPRQVSHSVYVTFTPDSAGITRTGTLVLHTDDASHASVTVTLTGSSTDDAGLKQYLEDVHTSLLYHFNETSGITVDDETGTHDGILKNGPARVAGLFGKGLSFDGINDWLYCAPDQGLVFDMRSASYTIEFFFKTDTVSQGICTLGPSDSANYGIHMDEHGRLDVKGFGSGGLRLNDNAWHHAAFVYNHLDTQGKLYVDGNLQWTRAWSGTPWTVPSFPLVIGAADSVKGFFHGMLDEFRISNIAREPWEFQLAYTGVDTEPADEAVFGSDLDLYIDVAQNLGALNSGVTLYYRGGGGTQYHDTLAVRVNSTRFRARIPAAAVPLTGIEYYVRIRTSTDTMMVPVLDPQNNPLVIPVLHTGVDAPARLEARSFRMLSIPFEMMENTKNIEDVFQDDFNIFDPYRARLFLWHPEKSQFLLDLIQELPLEEQQNYSPYFTFPDTVCRVPRDSAGDEIVTIRRSDYAFAPGKTFWMITDMERRFDIGSGRSVSTDSSYEIFLDPGWNMVGNPFGFQVDWNACALTSDSVSTLYYFAGEDSNYLMDRPVLDPWEGYWMYNARAGRAALIVSPRDHGLAKVQGVRGGSTSGLAENEWMFKLSLKSGAILDLDNYAGMRHTGATEWDIHDRPEPPLMSQTVFLAFDHSDWKSHAGWYAADIRKVGSGDGQVWDLSVRTWFKDQSVTLTWQLYEKLPDGWDAVLLDLEEGTATHMLQNSRKAFTTSKTKPNVRRFRLVAGTEDFILSQSGDIPLVPVEFALSQNYPNPFNAGTEFVYSLPKRCEITLTVYNALGQRVRTLFEGVQRSGHHTVYWDGLDERGIAVASGVYFYKLATPEKTASRKMVYMK